MNLYRISQSWLGRIFVIIPLWILLLVIQLTIWVAILDFFSDPDKPQDVQDQILGFVVNVFIACPLVFYLARKYDYIVLRRIVLQIFCPIYLSWFLLNVIVLRSTPDDVKNRIQIRQDAIALVLAWLFVVVPLAIFIMVKIFG
ncbi:MAG: hypothetical protein OXC81_05835 [Betaproteobacteria bacterium]|nr:hypothetical protein [Betaproteobacteria bacterium]